MTTILSILKNKTSLSRAGNIKKVTAPVLLMLTAFATAIQATGQADQRIALGDKYFAAGEYYTAAGLYEQYLNPSKKEIPQANFPVNSRRFRQSSTGNAINKLDILYKQAESYRLANYWPEAAARYKECFEKDFSKYAPALYWYAVCQRSLGKYAAAEEYMIRFLKIEMTDNALKPEAEKELQTIAFIKTQLLKPDTVLYHIQKNKAPFGREKGIFALTSVNSNQFIFTSTVTDAATVNGENPNRSRLFYAALTDGALENVELVPINEADASFNQGAASISPDKKTLYFTQWKKENGKNISSIYHSKMEETGWGKPQLLSSVNTEGYSSRQPYCSVDGKFLFFASDRPGGAGGFDIWYAPLQADGTTGTPVNAGIVNTKEDEQAPFYHTGSGTLVFSSNGGTGMGGFDFFTAKMNGASFEKAENMGYPVNSSRDDIYFYAPDNGNLLANAVIGSDRGSECCLETYTIVKSPKKKTITGIVVDCKTHAPLPDAVVIMKGATVKSSQTKTAPDGKFSFDIAEDIHQQSFSVIKEGYTDKTEKVKIESINDKDVMIDLYTNTAICMEKIVIEEKKLVIKAENVVTLYFDFDKSILKERERQILDSVYAVLAENKTYTIQISGYTDGMGTDEYNNKLSDRRAKAAADYLKAKGIEASRISFVSFGECCPVEMEIINGRDNPDGRSKNRRALINITKEE